MATDQVTPGAGAATVVNANFEAGRAAMMYGRRASTTGTPSALTWGYYGGQFDNTNAVSDGTLTLTNSATNYIVAAKSNGAVSSATTTTNWNDSTNYIRLYEVVCAGGVVTGYTDRRPSVYNAAGGGSGTVTSVAYSFDASLADVFSIGGSPVTSSGTLTASAVDAGSDKLPFWDDSANKLTWLTVGANLSITGTTINATGGGTPAGSSGYVQYNSGGSFGAEAAFAYDDSTNTLSVDKITLNGLLLTLASASGGAGLRIPHGAAPSSPVNGDVWTTTAGIYVRINGATVGPLAVAGGGSGFNSCVKVDTANGTGSTGTCIRRWTNTRINTGSDITYADSAANGSTFTINTTGVYDISYQDGNSNVGGVGFGITVNSSQLSTAFNPSNLANKLSGTDTSTTGYTGHTSWCGPLTAGDVVRPHISSASASGTAMWTIQRVG